MKHAMYVNPVGISGGIAIWWTNEIVISFSHISKNIIDSEVQFGSDGRKMWISWIYGDPDFRRRTLNWSRLKVIGQNRTEPWIAFGDFNDICSHGVKMGERRKDQRKINGFTTLLDEIRLGDLGFKGQMHTWSNNRRGED